jgi:hypothetical protein
LAGSNPAGMRLAVGSGETLDQLTKVRTMSTPKKRASAIALSASLDVS